MNFRFAEPEYLLLLVIPLLLAVWRHKRSGLAFGGFLIAARSLRPSRTPLLHKLLLCVALASLIIAAARPQMGRSVVLREHSGRDIMLVIDLSASMITDDMFTTNEKRIDRLEAVMTAAKEFVKGRPSDRIGLVFFATTALTSCPLTLDHAAVLSFLEGIEEQQRRNWSKTDIRGFPEGILGPGTNTGLGLAKALAYLEGKAEAGKAIVLITDGRDSQQLSNWVDPITAAVQARKLDVRIHAVGVGDENGTMSDLFLLKRTGQRVYKPLPREFLPDMNRIADITEESEGIAMQAGDSQELEQVFARIDELEPSIAKESVREDFTDRFPIPLAIGALLLAIALVFETRLRGIPT